jgi:hypothetical protein
MQLITCMGDPAPPTLCLGLAWRLAIHSLFPSFVLARRGVVNNGEHVVGEQRWWAKAFYPVEEER